MKFSDKKEKKVQNKFLKNGYLIFEVNKKRDLDFIKKKIENFSNCFSNNYCITHINLQILLILFFLVAIQLYLYSHL